MRDEAGDRVLCDIRIGIAARRDLDRLYELRWRRAGVVDIDRQGSADYSVVTVRVVVLVGVDVHR